MVEQFVGNWTLVNSDKFDDYMKAVGKLVHFVVFFFFLIKTMHAVICCILTVY